MRRLAPLFLLFAIPFLVGVDLPFGQDYVRDYVLGRLSEMAGREMEVTGTTEVTLGWESSMRLEGVRVANADWGEAPHLLELEALVVTLDMRRLLNGEVRLPQLRLIGPKLYLEVSADGDPNWLLGGAEQTIVESAAAPGGEPGNLPRIDRLEVTEGELAYRDHLAETPRWVRGHIETAAGRLDEARTAFGASGSLGEERYSILLRAAPLDALRAGERPNPIYLLATAGGARLMVDGTAVAPFALQGIDLALEAHGAGFHRLPLVTGLPESPPFDLSARLRRDAGPWRLEALEAAIGRSRMQGQLALDLRGERSRLPADLAAQTFAMDELMAIVPSGAVGELATETVRDGVDLSGLDAVNADVELTAQRLLVRELQLEGVRGALRIEDGVLILAPLAAAAGGGRVRTHLVLSQDPVQANASLALEGVHLDRALRRDGEDGPRLGVLEGSVALELPPRSDVGPGAASRIDPERALQRLRVQEGQLSYREPDQATELVLALGAGAPFPGPRIRLAGQFRGTEVQADLDADPLTAVVGEDPYRLDGHLRVGGSEGEIRARLLAPPGLEDLQVRFDLAGDVEELASITGLALPSLPDVEAAGVLRRDGPRWHARELDLRAGASDLRGRVLLARTQPQPRIEVELRSQTLDLRTLLPEGRAGAGDGPDGPDGPGEVPPWLAAAQGRLSYEAGEILTAGPRFAGLALDTRLAAGHLRLQSLRLGYRQPEQDTRLELDVADAPASRTPPGRAPLAGTLQGRLFGQRLAEDVRGSASLDLREADPAGSWRLHLDPGETDLRLSGTLRNLLLSPGSLALDLRSAGPSAAGLSDLLGVALPATPDYRLSTHLRRDAGRLIFEEVDARIGGTDLSGRIAADPDNHPPAFDLYLRSERLVWEDLAEAFGDGSQRPSGRLFTDEPLGLKALGESLQGRLRYRAEDVAAGATSLQDLRLDARLRNGRLHVSPLRLGVGGGRLRLDLEVDTTARPPQADLEGEVAQVHLGRLLEPFEIADDAVGKVGGRLKLWLAGESAAELAASADGGLFLVMTGGALDRLLVEAAGLDVGEAALALASDDRVPLECAYLNLQSRAGLAQIETLAIDTADTLFVGGGEVDLAGERLELVVEARPKDPSVPAFSSPLRWEGPLSDPQLRILSGELAGRIAAAVGLAAIQPLAGLIPLIETGPGRASPYCDGLMQGLREARR